MCSLDFVGRLGRSRVQILHSKIANVSSEEFNKHRCMAGADKDDDLTSPDQHVVKCETQEMRWSRGRLETKNWLGLCPKCRSTVMHNSAGNPNESTQDRKP